MDNFEWYKPRGNRPYVSITRYRICLSEGLIEEMGRPTWVKLGYSDKSRFMLIKECLIDDECKIKVTGGQTPRIVNRGFIRFLISKGITIEDKAKKYIAIWNKGDEICLVELKG